MKLYNCPCALRQLRCDAPQHIPAPDTRMMLYQDDIGLELED